MLLARQFIGATTTALSLITAAFFPALAVVNARAQGSAPACDAAGEIALLPSPWAPWKGAPLRVMLVTEKPLRAELSLTGPDGSVAATSRERHGGPPYFWFTEIKAPEQCWPEPVNSRFVDTGHLQDAFVPQSPLEARQPSQALTLSAVLKAPPCNGLQNRAGPWARVLFQRSLRCGVERPAFPHIVAFDVSKRWLFHSRELNIDLVGRMAVGNVPTSYSSSSSRFATIRMAVPNGAA